MTLQQAIGHIEGYYAVGEVPNRPQRNRNPGNLNFAAWLGVIYGAVKESGPNGRFAVFKTVDDGWSALTTLLSEPSRGYVNLTVEAAINRYAPPVENNTTNYVGFVCKSVGCKPSDLVKDVLARA